MRSHPRVVLLAFVGLLAAVPSARAQQDAKGSQDHPLVTRMPGYDISGYKVEEFAAFDPTVVGGKDVHWEGRKYVIDYTRQEGAAPTSMLQIVRNYEGALAKVGGKRLGGDERRVAEEVRTDGAMTGVYVEAFNDGADYEVTIVETQAMKQEVTADAAAMARDLKATGRTVIPGIYFDTGSAVINPESDPALAEMVKLLNANATMRAFVVGHTDNVGALEMNLKLSADRAAAVVKALVGRGIPAVRLKSAGVGPYSPIASNKEEDGRAKNRRVELVEQ